MLYILAKGLSNAILPFLIVGTTLLYTSTVYMEISRNGKVQLYIIFYNNKKIELQQ